MEKFDITVIGAGPGGYVAAIRAAQLGANVCVIENREVGGTCLNRGCIPSKALLTSSHYWDFLKKADQFGINIESSNIDFSKMMERKDKVVSGLRSGIEMLFKKNKITLINGFAKIATPNEIKIENNPEIQSIDTDKIIIATGSEPLKFSFIPFDGERVVTSDDILFQDKLPESMIILGGGVIGCEFATLFAELGVQVSLVEMMPQLIPGSDGDIAKELTKCLKKKRIKLHVGTKLDDVKIDGDKVTGLLVQEGKDPKTIEADKLLVSVGRKLLTENIGLEELGIELEERSKSISVNEYCQTSIPNIYAIGDITAKWMLAHFASKQGIVAAEHALGHNPDNNMDIVPACIFTHPAIGSVGLTEEQATDKGHTVKTSKFQYRALGKAHAIGSIDGFFKIIADESTEEILGIHIIGPDAENIIAEAALAMKMGAKVHDIANTIHAHPTLAEGLFEAAEGWFGKAIHG